MRTVQAQALARSTDEGAMHGGLFTGVNNIDLNLVLYLLLSTLFRLSMWTACLSAVLSGKQSLKQQKTSNIYHATHGKSDDVW